MSNEEGAALSGLFTGVSDLQESRSVKGTPASRLPAFVLGE